MELKEPIIKVGILLNSNIEFKLKGNFLFNSKIISSGNYSASYQSGIIDCSNIAGNVTTIKLIPESSASTFILKNVTIGIGFHWEQQEQQEFEGGLSLQIEDEQIRAVNTIPLENYLKSVISSEMSAMNDLTLLKVHTIVSRSWLLAQIQNRDKKQPNYFVSKVENTSTNMGELEIIKWYDREEHDTFDVCADDHCQRYQGISKIISENALKAVDATRGIVLTYNNEICDARFSKCCGGITEDFENVWQPMSINYLTAVRDEVEDNLVVNNNYFTNAPKAYCNTSDPKILKQVLIDFDQNTTDFYRWTVEFTQQELTLLLHKKSGFDFGQIINLIPLKRGKSGRIIQLKIVGSKKVIIVGKELEIRKWLSESHLYSSAFIVKREFKNDEPIPSKFILFGAGWGHGVGLCQIGAAVMSQKGFTVEAILSHYFFGTSLKPYSFIIK